jgi:hypothetical protein
MRVPKRAEQKKEHQTFREKRRAGGLQTSTGEKTKREKVTAM